MQTKVCAFWYLCDRKKFNIYNIIYLYNIGFFAKAGIRLPALLKGLEFAHILYGNLPWHDIVEPSAKLARDGFVVSKDLVDEVSRNADYGTHYNGPLNPGDILQLHELANTLDMVAEYGVKGTLCIILFLQFNLQLQIIIFMQYYFDFLNRIVLKLLNFF